MKEYKLLPEQLQELTLLEIIMMGIDPTSLEPKGETITNGLQGIREFFANRRTISPIDKLKELSGRQR